MSKNRAMWAVVVVLGLAVALYAVLGVVALRRHATQPPQRVAVDPRVAVIGRQVRPISVSLADGHAVQIPDGRRYTAVALGSAAWLPGAAAGLSQLTVVLPDLTYLLVPRGAVPAGLAITGARGVGQVGGNAAALDKQLGGLIAPTKPQDGDWWLIGPSGRVEACGAPDTGAMMEAGIAWPFLRQLVETPPEFHPTPIAKLSPDGSNRHWRDRILALWRHRLVDGYQQYGHHGPWDEQALAFLELRCRYLARHDSHGDPITADLDARRLLAAGCDDPLILSSCAAAIRLSEGEDRVGDLDARAMHLLPQSHYPPRVAYLIALRSDDMAQRESLTAQALTGDFLPGEQRLDARLLSRSADGGHGKLPASLRTAVAQAGGDLWLRAWLDGGQLNAAAGAARGTEAAALTSAGQFGEFERLLKEGAKSTALALRLHPDFPEAADDMLSVAQGTGGLDDRRYWVERTLGADINYSVAHGYYTTLLPRWGGSHEEMHAFAREMSDPSLAATDAPLAAWQLLRSLQWDVRGDHLPQNQTLIAETLAALDAMIEAASTPQRAARLRTCKAAFLLAAQREDEAAEVVDAVGDRLDTGTVRDLDRDAWQKLSTWCLDRELGEGVLSAAAEKGKAGHLAECLEALQALEPKAHTRPAKHVLELQIDVVRAELAAAAARDNQPLLEGGYKALRMDAAMSDWSRLDRELTPDAVHVGDDGVFSYHDEHDATLIYQTDLAANVEVALQVHVAGATSSVSFSIAHSPSEAGAIRAALWGNGAVRGSTGTSAHMDPKEWHDVRLRLQDGHGTVTVDGQSLPGPKEGAPEAPRQFQMTLRATGQSEPIRIRHLGTKALTP